MKLFNMDLHISVIGDFKSLGLDVEITDWCLSGHAHIMNRTRDNPNHINPNTWLDLNPQMIQEFQKTYDSFLQTFDGFIVGYPNVFAMVFEKYNKPIILINACRYDMPFCFKRETKYIGEYHGCLYRLLNKGLLHTVSNNRVDQLYMGKGCGIKPEYVIPSLCLYTNMKYNPTKPTFLLYSGNVNHPLISQKSTNFEWKDIGEFRGVIHFPYEAGLTMSMFEHFTAGTPMFIPSKAYWKAHPNIQSSSAYWGVNPPPNLSEFKDDQFWIENSCMWETFASPNTVIFDSIEDLIQKLETFEYTPEGDFRERRIESVKLFWRQLIAKIQTHSLRTKSPTHLCYNRLPLLANSVYDANYSEYIVKVKTNLLPIKKQSNLWYDRLPSISDSVYIKYPGSGVVPQHSYLVREPSALGDYVFVKTDYLDWFLSTRKISTYITLVTGSSDLSPSESACEIILTNPNVKRWIGCNITARHPKIYKIPIGVGEPERPNGNHEELIRLHSSRIPWESKSTMICIPFHRDTHKSRSLEPTLPKLPFSEYMTEIGKHKFVVCMRGNGLDTHRVCEILLMGSVPVLLHSGLDDMYERFPCLLVDSFETIDTSGFTWDPVKYEQFLDIFWMKLEDLQAFLAK